ncbi:MAG: TrmH family RNA methyltransferase [Fibrobacter sp.]|nr:TrmH family RNA methyltransferase [Fibrobacter sp.]
MKPTSKAKRMAELLRVIILQLGDDVARAKKEYETYADWLSLPVEERLAGKNQAQMIDLYKTFRTRAGLGFERDVYLEQEPGDRLVANEEPISFAVLVHNLRSAFNVGSIIRSTDCFGLQGVHLSGYSCGPDHVTVKSAARGCQDWIPIRRWDSPLECIQYHKENGYEIIALETGEDIPSIGDVKWPQKGLVVLGNEELGIAPELMEQATLKVTIPMAGRKASMNVAGAFAIMAFCLRSAAQK